MENISEFVGSTNPICAEGLSRSADKAAHALPSAHTPIIHIIQELQVRRRFYIRQNNRAILAAKALVRRATDGDKDRASAIVDRALRDKPQKPEDEDIAAMLLADLIVMRQMMEPCIAARNRIELDMKRAVRQLPIHAWGRSVHGLGELGMSVIVGEAGDLGSYPKKGHLWKRLGLAALDGQAMSTWRMKGGLTAEDWTDAGYSPQRRAEIHAVVAEPLFRAQTVVQGPYHGIYHRRRAHMAETHPDWTKMHSHMDGLRVMTKYLIRDMWREWRKFSA